MVAMIRLPGLYANVGKLYAELRAVGQALRLLEAKLGERGKKAEYMDLYYSMLRRRQELKGGLDAALAEIQRHPSHPPSASLALVSAWVSG